MHVIAAEPLNGVPVGTDQRVGALRARFDAVPLGRASMAATIDPDAASGSSAMSVFV
jgi:hypothetical protein